MKRATDMLNILLLRKQFKINVHFLVINASKHWFKSSLLLTKGDDVGFAVLEVHQDV